MRTALVIIVIAAAGLAVAWSLARRGPTPPPPAPAPDYITLAGHTMGGTWSVKLLRLPPDIAREPLESRVAAVLEKLDAQMSTYRPVSDLSRFNASGSTDWFPVPRELAELVSLAQRVSEETGGAFDVTVAPLVDLWGFGAGRATVPTAPPPNAAVATARARVGYRRLAARLDPPALKKDRPDVRIDLGGIAKGYAADAVGALLDSIGIADSLVQVGGETRARGRSHPGRPWRVGIETPTPDVRRILAQVELADASLSTSGDYRNFFDQHGQRFSHEIDPRTGVPARTSVASVSVIHPSGAYADAMATALMILPPDEAAALVERLDLAVLFVRRGNDRFETRPSPPFAARLVAPPSTVARGR
jgi:thiamine biosynthesis lipoprotein